MNTAVTAMRRIVVLISGRGSNLQALLQASRQPDANFEVTQVLSDQPHAPGLRIAQALGVATLALPAARGVERTLYDGQLRAAIDAQVPALIVLAGFMRILSAQFVRHYAGLIINIHPSLLPEYPGLHTHRRVLAARGTRHGATVHFVTEELDGGPAILQAALGIRAGEDEASLSARVQQLEHSIYPPVVTWFCSGRLAYREQGAWFDGVKLTKPMQWPIGLDPGAAS